MKKLLIVLLLVLSGCATPKPALLPGEVLTPPSTVTKPDAEKPKETINIDQRLLTACNREWASVDRDKVSMADILIARDHDLSLSTQCANNHDDLIDVVKKAFNIK